MAEREAAARMRIALVDADHPVPVIETAHAAQAVHFLARLKDDRDVLELVTQPRSAGGPACFEKLVHLRGLLLGDDLVLKQPQLSGSAAAGGAVLTTCLLPFGVSWFIFPPSNGYS